MRWPSSPSAPWRGEDVDEHILRHGHERGRDGQTTQQFGDQAELDEVFGAGLCQELALFGQVVVTIRLLGGKADGVLAELAQRALARDTGARALRSVLEEVMLELMYDLPDLNNTNARYIIDAAAIEQRKPLAELRVSKKSA